MARVSRFLFPFPVCIPPVTWLATLAAVSLPCL
jgi:hypothetical protein